MPTDTPSFSSPNHSLRPWTREERERIRDELRNSDPAANFNATRETPRKADDLQSMKSGRSSKWSFHNMHRPKLKMPAPLAPSLISNLQEQVEGSMSSRATSDRYVTRTPLSKRSFATGQSMHRRVASQPSNFSFGNSSRGGHRRAASVGTSVPDIRLQPPSSPSSHRSVAGHTGMQAFVDPTMVALPPTSQIPTVELPSAMGTPASRFGRPRSDSGRRSPLAGAGPSPAQSMNFPVDGRRSPQPPPQYNSQRRSPMPHALNPMGPPTVSIPSNGRVQGMERNRTPSPAFANYSPQPVAGPSRSPGHGHTPSPGPPEHVLKRSPSQLSVASSTKSRSSYRHFDKSTYQDPAFLASPNSTFRPPSGYAASVTSISDED